MINEIHFDTFDAHFLSQGLTRAEGAEILRRAGFPFENPGVDTDDGQKLLAALPDEARRKVVLGRMCNPSATLDAAAGWIESNWRTVLPDLGKLL